MRLGITLVWFTLVVIANAATANAQNADFVPGSRIQKLQRDILKTQFGADHPVVIDLEAQIRREAIARTNPEIVAVPMKLEELDDKSFRRFVVTLLKRIAALEKEVAMLKARVSELENPGDPAIP